MFFNTKYLSTVSFYLCYARNIFLSMYLSLSILCFYLWCPVYKYQHQLKFNHPTLQQQFLLQPTAYISYSLWPFPAATLIWPKSGATPAVPLPCTGTARSGHTGINPAPPCMNRVQIRLGYTYMHHNQGNRSSPIDTIHNWSHDNQADMCKHRLRHHIAETKILPRCSYTAGKHQECIRTQHMLNRSHETQAWHMGLCKTSMSMHICNVSVLWSSGKEGCHFFFYNITDKIQTRLRFKIVLFFSNSHVTLQTNQGHQHWYECVTFISR